MTQNFHTFRHKKKNCQERVDIPAILFEKSGERNKKFAPQSFYCVLPESIVLKSGFRAVTDSAVQLTPERVNGPLGKIFYGFRPLSGMRPFFFCLFSYG
jgi:hypothetical protein